MLTDIQKKRITEWYEEHEQQLLDDIAALCAYDSERRDALPGMPYGKEAADCVAAAAEMISGYGFEVTNYDNYVLAADMGPAPRKLDILAHLDVVPVNAKNWTVTEPFKCKIVDGKIYGRGTCDDKGPAVVTLYAMRAIKELGLPITSGIRLILGSDEECGSSDLEYYFTKEKSAPYSFSPDAEFPLINIEKGRLAGGFDSEITPAASLPRVTEIHSGSKLNIVPDEAEAVVEGLEAAEVEAVWTALAIADKEVLKLTCTGDAKSLKLFIKGRSAHASTPEGGCNALIALLTLISALPLSDEQLHAQIKAVNKLFPYGDHLGQAAGIALEDPESGKSTFSLNLFHLNGSHMQGMIDGRVSMQATEENTAAPLKAAFSALELLPMNIPMNEAHYVSAESDIVKKLMAAWTEVTGLTAKPLAIGGGTYVHHIENGVAFGCGELDVDTHMHGDDEYMEIAQIRKSYEILVRAILNLCA